MYKILACDIDGTLFNDEKKITEKNKIALKEMMDNGIHIVLSSGRYYEGLLPIIEDLDIRDTLHVADNGISYFNREKDINFFDCFDPKDYKKLIEHLRKTCKSFIVTNKDGMWYETEDERCKKTMLPNNGLNAQYVKMDDVLDVPDPFKICAYYESEEEREAILEKEYEKITGCVSYKVLIDFYPKGIDKYRTLLKVAELMGVKEDEIAAIGDSDNDLPIIKYSKLGICVQNASDSIKGVADVVLKETNNEDPFVSVRNILLKDE